jgi:hypothetical protein
VDRELLFGDLEAIKLFSMQEPPQVSYLYNYLKGTHVVSYYPKLEGYVKMLMAISREPLSRGQPAWVCDPRYSTLLVCTRRHYAHQRLNEEYLKNSKD